MNKYLYERIAPIWIASPAKLHWDNCNLHFVYSKKRKSEICAFCCFYFIYFFLLLFSNWDARYCQPAHRHSFSLSCSILLSGNIYLLFYSMFSCNVHFTIDLFLFFPSFFGCSLQWKIFMCYCANWIQLAYSQSVDFAWAQLKPHLNEVLISLPIKSLEKKRMLNVKTHTKDKFSKKQKQKQIDTFVFTIGGKREKIRWLKTGKNQIDREKKEKLRRHAKSIMRWRLLLFLCWARNFTAL